MTALTGSMSSVIMEEMNFDVAELAEEAQQILGMYTEEQQAVHNRILDAIKNDNRLALYINAKGGCGKTFLLNGILRAVRSLDIRLAAQIRNSLQIRNSPTLEEVQGIESGNSQRLDFPWLRRSGAGALRVARGASTGRSRN